VVRVLDPTDTLEDPGGGLLEEGVNYKHFVHSMLM
jgi:hypothetical protein